MDLGLEALSNLTIFSKYAKFKPEFKRREPWDEIVDRYQEMMIKKYPLCVAAGLLWVLAFAAPIAAAEKTFQLDIPGCGA